METTLRCPRDGAELSARHLGGRIHGFRIEACEKCKGTWFDRGELRRVTHDAAIEKMIRDYATSASNPIACVRDGSPMKRRKIEDVEIDVCAKCGGFWVDGGELEALEAAARDVETGERGHPSLYQALSPRDVAILAWIAPDTLTKLQHETSRGQF
jgi:Zn-finger nucleic acid-binding protein